MNIYLQELKMSLRSVLNWTLGMLAMVFFFMLMFPAVSKDAAAMEQIISKFPPELTRALGLTTLDLSTVLGFYGFLFTYILLIGSVYAMKSGFSVLSEEIRSKATDFLVTKPVSRATIVTAKWMSVMTFILLQNIIFIIGSIVIVKVTADQSFHLGTFLLIDLSLLFVQLFFVALGMLLSVIIKKVKSVLPITLGIVFGFFVLQMLNQSLADEKLTYITPFAYFDFSKIITNINYDYIYLVVDLIIITICTVFTYIIYNKKDMPSI